MALKNDDKKLSTKGILVDDLVVGRSIGSAFIGDIGIGK